MVGAIVVAFFTLLAISFVLAQLKEGLASANKRMRAIDLRIEGLSLKATIPTITVGMCDCKRCDSFDVFRGGKVPTIQTAGGTPKCSACGREYKFALTPVERRKQERKK